MVRIICGDKVANKLNTVPLSDDTVARRIREMSANVKSTVVECVKSSSYFAIQLDETTDISDVANLLVYIRYEFASPAQEEFLFCQLLQTRTTAEHILNLLNEFMQENGLDWNKCVGVCTDGARALTGRHSGVVARIRAVAPDMR